MLQDSFTTSAGFRYPLKLVLTCSRTWPGKERFDLKDAVHGQAL
jgi:hypothetical protein